MGVVFVKFGVRELYFKTLPVGTNAYLLWDIFKFLHAANKVLQCRWMEISIWMPQ